jgi:hypothetical protein
MLINWENGVFWDVMPCGSSTLREVHRLEVSETNLEDPGQMKGQELKEITRELQNLYSSHKVLKG